MIDVQLDDAGDCLSPAPSVPARQAVEGSDGGGSGAGGGGPELEETCRMLSTAIRGFRVRRGITIQSLFNPVQRNLRGVGGRREAAVVVLVMLVGA